MRRVLLSCASAAVLACTVSTATAQAPPIGIGAQLTLGPGKLGTESSPRPARLSGTLTFRTPGSTSTVATGASVRLPRGIRLRGGETPRCRKATLQAVAGLRNCPSGSIVGYAVAPSFAEEVVGPRPRITLVNGGPRRLWAYTVFTVPAYVQEALPVAIRPLGGRRWAYELTFEVPSSMRVLAGVPVTLPRRMNVGLGGAGRGEWFLTTERRCPKRGFLGLRLEITHENEDGPGATSLLSRLRCR